MGYFLPKMPVAFRVDSDFKIAERSSVHWTDPVVTHEKMSMCVPFLLLSPPCLFARLSDVHLSWSFVFMEVRNSNSIGEEGFPVYCKPHWGFYFSVLDCNSAQGYSRGGLHLKLIYVLQNTVSCILEK